MINKTKFTDFLKSNNNNYQMNIGMNKLFSTGALYKYIASFLLIFISSFAYSQCSPKLQMRDGSLGVLDTFCVNELITFKHNSPGYTSIINWDFGNPESGASVDQDPTYGYPSAGSFTITLTASGAAGSCTETLNVVIKPSPEIGIELLDDSVQCFSNNEFCFRDTTQAPDGNIIRQTALFSDGTRYDTLFDDGVTRKAIDWNFCHTITDPAGGWFDLVIESEDESGCISRVVYEDIIFVHPNLGVSFNNITPRPNPGCDSTLGVFDNTSIVPLADVDSFYWDFGDGITEGGNSTTNTEWWVGEDNDRIIRHMYKTHGSFDGSLIVEAYGCTDVFTWKAAVGNIVMEPKIISLPNPACTPDNPIEFSVADLPASPGVSGFLWNFGDPPSGPANTNDRTLVPTKSYGPGPWMVSLRLIAGPCDITIYDTVQVIGPGSTIEVAFDRVSEDETYQCIIEDSVHFPNNSSYYQNDWNRDDEDSITYYYDYTFDYVFDNTTGLYSFHYKEWEERPRGNFLTLDSTYGSGDTIKMKAFTVYFDTAKDSLAAIRLGDTTWHKTRYGAIPQNSFRFGVNPKRRWVFKYTPPVGKGGVGVGDQTAEAPAVVVKGYNPNVWRVWEMGDRFAPQCTTDSRPWVNKNVGINCNWTIDSTPVHWYTPWDDIYRTFQDGRNYTRPVRDTRLFKGSGAGDTFCYQVQVYPSNPMIIPADTVLTIPIDSSFTYRGVTIPAGVYYKNDTLGNWTVRRTPSVLIGTEFYWDAALDTFVAVNNLYDTTYHNENWVGRNNPTAGNATTTWTATFHDVDIYIPTGVTITTLKLPAPGGGGAGVGNTRTLVGPQTVTILADEQFYISSKDSVEFLIKVEEGLADTTYGTASTYPVLEEKFGILTKVFKSKVFVDSAKHREDWFLDNAQCFNVLLWQKDTIHPLQCESEGTKSLALIPPKAKGLKWVSGIPCPFDGSKLDYVLTFDISETKPGCSQRWFAANLDSLADPDAFLPFDGGLLAPPPPGLPIPFVLPYDIRGNLGVQFVKGYTPGEIGSDPTLRNPNGSFTLGLIVGNGKMVPTPAGSATMRPECMDTFWYNDLFQILYLNAGFDIIEPTTPKKVICAGGDAWFQIQEPIQDSISVLRWAWGYQGVGKGPDLDIYVERFEYYKPYNGPVKGRNDENVVYNGENWLYNYVIRETITDFGGYEVIDTIVATIIKDWKVVVDTRNAGKAIVDAFDAVLGLDYQDLPPEEIPFYLGTPGCLDTSGLSDLFRFGTRAYSEKSDPDVWIEGDKRMRCTSYSPRFVYDREYVPSKLDPSIDSLVSIDSSFNYNRDDCVSSYEVSHILHFRDSSIQGYDTIMMDTSGNGLNDDRVGGVWYKSYTFPEELTPDACKPTEKDTVMRAANGPMVPTLFLNNTVGCEARSAALLNVGFYNDYWLENENLCQGLTLFVSDRIRYYQYGEEDPFTYPYNETPYWQDPVRYSNNIEYHRVDWGEADTFEWKRSIVLNHLYTEPGTYNITIAPKDSVGCSDTTVLTAYISRINPDFILPDSILSCEAIVNFMDSTWVEDPCRDTCEDGTILSCESLIKWEWDFGDGTRHSFLQNPSHNFTSGGYFDVKLKVWSELGCLDSITKTIYIPGPQPRFEFEFPGWVDTAQVCIGDSVFLLNTSMGDRTDPSFSMDWGDGNFSSPDTNGVRYGHLYTVADTFELYLIQEDVMPDGNRCSRIWPDTSDALLVKHKMIVIVNPRPVVEISVNDSIVCPDEQVTFTVDTLDERYTELYWHMGDPGNNILSRNPTEKTVTFTYSQPGQYRVKLAPRYWELPRCWDSAFANLTVVDVKADFSIDSSLRPEFCFTNLSTGADSTKYQWTFQDDPLDGSSNEIDPCYNWDDRRGTFEVCLIAESSEGCKDTICKEVENSFFRTIYPYNVFTPNGDGKNDEYIVEGESVEEYEIKIFNRWGERVFYSTDITKSWNGKVDNTKATCPEGTYFYIINYKFIFGEKNEGLGPIEGQVQLIRDEP